jgi:hypothetical protein
MVHRALVKQTSDLCRTAEFLIKACWKEDAHAVAREPQKEMAIESSTNKIFFQKMLFWAKK